MKSWGVIAARFHFSLFTSSSSICCENKREERGKERRKKKRGKAWLAPLSIAPGPPPATPRPGRDRAPLGAGGQGGPGRPPPLPGQRRTPRGRQGAPAPRPARPRPRLRLRPGQPRGPQPGGAGGGPARPRLAAGASASPGCGCRGRWGPLGPPGALGSGSPLPPAPLQGGPGRRPRGGGASFGPEVPERAITSNSSGLMELSV